MLKSLAGFVSKRSLLTLAIAGVAGLVGAQSAHAALILTLTEAGHAPVSVSDTLDSGQVTFFGTYGDFSANIVVGFSNITTGDQSTAFLQLQSLDVTNTS